MSNSTITRIGASDVHIGPFTYGIERIDIKEWGGGANLKIGSFCSIAFVTIILDGNHTTNWMTTFPFARIAPDHPFYPQLGGIQATEPPSSNGDVIIGNDVWIGERVMIMSGVTIGDGAVLAANTHVTKDVMPYEIVGGNPAKTIRKRFDDEIIGLLIKLSWWDLPIEAIREIKKHLLSEPTAGLLHFLIAKYRI